MLLNRRHAAGVVTRFVKVMAHFGEPLNEAADALASAAAEANDSPLPSRETNSAHFYIHGAPVEWGASLRDSLIQVAADRAAGGLGRPKKKAWRLGEACPDNSSMDAAAGPGPVGPRQGLALQEN
jgi:hypothetical protein